MTVVISITPSGLRMESDGREVGNWDPSMYSLVASAPGSYVLHAEDDSLVFRPDSPEDFDVAIAPDGVDGKSGAGPGRRGAHLVESEPNARPLTMVLFYLLMTATLAMGVWAAVSLLD